MATNMEQLVFDADGCWVDNTGFSMLNEEDEYNEKGEKVYFFEWYTKDGLTTTIHCTDTELNKARVVNPVNGYIEVKDVEGNLFTIQLLKAMDLRGFSNE